MFKFIICIAIAYRLGNISGGMIFGKLLFNKKILAKRDRVFGLTPTPIRGQ